MWSINDEGGSISDISSRVTSSWTPSIMKWITLSSAVLLTIVGLSSAQNNQEPAHQDFRNMFPGFNLPNFNDNRSVITFQKTKLLTFNPFFQRQKTEEDSGQLGKEGRSLGLGLLPGFQGLPTLGGGLNLNLNRLLSPQFAKRREGHEHEFVGDNFSAPEDSESQDFDQSDLFR